MTRQIGTRDQEKVAAPPANEHLDVEHDLLAEVLAQPVVDQS